MRLNTAIFHFILQHFWNFVKFYNLNVCSNCCDPNSFIHHSKRQLTLSRSLWLYLTLSGESSRSFFLNLLIVSSIVLPILSLISPSFSLKGKAPLLLSQSSSHLFRSSSLATKRERRKEGQWHEKSYFNNQKSRYFNSTKTHSDLTLDTYCHQWHLKNNFIDMWNNKQ